MTEYLLYFSQQWVGDHSEEWFRPRGPLAMAVETEGKKASEVAKKWVDENEAVWKPWVDQATQ